MTKIMKKIILLVLTALMMAGCTKKKSNGEPIVFNRPIIDNPYIQVLDSCEYICWNNRMAHKGNCKYCSERRKQELKEFVEQLKE